MGILTDPDEPDREQRELRAGKDKKGVTAKTDKYGGIYRERERTIVCSSKFCNVAELLMLLQDTEV